MSSGTMSCAPLDFTVFQNVINGKLASSASGETYHTVNPSTLESNPRAPVSTLEDVNNAVGAAQKAAVTWADVPWLKRREALEYFATAIEELADDFSRLIVRENGKPLSWALVEIQNCVKFIRGFCALSLPDRVIEDTAERRVVERFVPLGVVVGIVPWNFPLMLAIFKLPAALLTGNTFILKPSPLTPYSGLKLAELACRFFPPGVFQALSGNDDLGPWLTGQEGVDMIAFTGSISTGKAILKNSGLKRVILEMGGNDPAIVCSDVDIAQVIPQIAGIAFVNSGQLCMAIKRLYVHEAIYDAFLAALVGFVKVALKVGDGFEQGSFIGPISHQVQFDRVKDYLEDIRQNDLSIALGSTEPLDRKGYYVSPVIVDNPPDDARIVTEERFGPILPLLKWSNEADVVRRANQTDYGLGASVWTKDSSQADRIAKKLKSGTIWINTHGELEPNVGFPGHKSSGYGVELGEEGLRAYCALQSTYSRPGKW